MSDTPSLESIHSPTRQLLLQGRLAAHKDKRDELVAQLLKMSVIMHTISACKLYLVSLSGIDAEGVYVTELWDTVEDHHAALQREDVRAIVVVTRPLINGAPSGARLAPLAAVPSSST